MLMLKFEQQRARLQHCNLRVERHGDDNVSVVDLKFSVEVSNDVLDSIDPQLKAALFRKPTKNDDPDLFDATADAAPLRKLKFPKMGPISWEVKWTGYSLTIHRAIETAPALFFTVPKIKELVIVGRDGGSTLIEFKLISLKPERQLDALSELAQTDVEITLLPPSAEEQQRLDEAEKQAA